MSIPFAIALCVFSFLAGIAYAEWRRKDSEEEQGPADSGQPRSSQ